MEVRKRTQASAAVSSTAAASAGAPPPSASSDRPTSTAASRASPNLTQLLLALLTFRILNALRTSTFFQPDEHYQTTEIAHRIVFGYGFKSWEWHGSSASTLANVSYPRAAIDNLLDGPIRSILHPLLYVPGYALLRLVGLDDTFLRIAFPRVQQALVAALGDFYTFRLAHRIGGARVAWFAMLVSLSNVYTLYTATRTFSNSTEAALTAAALFYWPFVPFFSQRFDVVTFATPQDEASLRKLQRPGCEWRRMLSGANKADAVDAAAQSDRDFDVKQVGRIIYDRTLRTSLWLAAAACLLRPTNGVLWMVLVSELLVRQLRCLRSKDSTPPRKGEATAARAGEGQDGSLASVLEIVGEMGSLARMLATIAGSTLVLALGVDTAYDYVSHQHSRTRWPLPALSLVAFVHKNVVANLSLFYGANPWHWYISSGLPVLCMIWLPSTLFGLVDALRSHAERRASLGRDITRSLARLVLATVAAYSLLGHKEFRFLQPLLPALAILAASGLVTSYAPGRETEADAAYTTSLLTQLWRVQKMLPLWLRALVMTLQPVLAMYLNTVHALGQETVPYELGKIYRAQQAELASNATASSQPDRAEFVPGFETISNLGFLMPCHSTPWATHLHDRQLVERSWFIECPPPPARSRMSPAQRSTEYRDQSDFFYHDPIKYLVDRFPYNVDTSFPAQPAPAHEWERSDAWDLGWRHSWPSHLVVFEALLSEGTRKVGHTRTLKNVLSLKGYREVVRFWNTPKHEDPRRDGDIVVLAYKGPRTRPVQST